MEQSAAVLQTRWSGILAGSDLGLGLIHNKKAGTFT
jgi:hypothetical protein